MTGTARWAELKLDHLVVCVEQGRRRARDSPTGGRRWSWPTQPARA
jgi:hypothetical protein